MCLRLFTVFFLSHWSQISPFRELSLFAKYFASILSSSCSSATLVSTLLSMIYLPISEVCDGCDMTILSESLKMSFSILTSCELVCYLSNSSATCWISFLDNLSLRVNSNCFSLTKASGIWSGRSVSLRQRPERRYNLCLYRDIGVCVYSWATSFLAISLISKRLLLCRLTAKISKMDFIA